jgi:hypothetical protein
MHFFLILQNNILIIKIFQNKTKINPRFIHGFTWLGKFSFVLIDFFFRTL